MRIGLTVSVIAHALLLSWMLWQLPGAKPFDVEAIDALPVDLVPIGALSQIAEGTKTAPKTDNASQGKARPPLPRPDSKRIGSADADQPTPPTDKAAKTAAAKEATPPPPPPKAPEKPPEKPAEPKPEKPAPPKAEAPKPEPSKPQAPPKPAEAPPKADVGEIAAKPDKAEPKKPDDAPKPAPPAPAVPLAKPKPPAPAETATADATPAKRDSKTTSPSRPDAKPDSKAEKFDPNQLASLLSKIDPSGGGAKASDKPASLGSEKRTGPVANMTQSELEALTAAITQCFNPPVGAAGIENLVVPLRVEFTADGDLAGPPQVMAVPPGPAGRAVADAAVRAVQRCAPYPFLPPEKYDTWRVVNMNFSPPSSY